MSDYISLRRDTVQQLVAHAKGLTIAMKQLELGFRHSKGIDKIMLDLECLLHRPDHDLTGLSDSDKG